MKQTVTVLGVPLTINTASTDPTHIEDVAKHVEQVASAIAKGAAPLPPHKLAVMTAMEISDELYRDAAAQLPEGRRAPSRIEAVIEKLEKAAKG